MSTRTFADIYDNGYRVEPSECNADAIYLTFLNNNPARWIAKADAPAVALAFLEAAGWNDDGPDHDECDPANVILVNLRDIVQDLAEEKRRAERAEREAEDAKVREFHAAIYGPNYIPDNAEVHETFRGVYRAAREFFAREEITPTEVIEPRTVASSWDLGPEHRDAEWQDNAGCYWRSIDHTWKWRSRPDAAWRCSSPEAFPWTEVLP